ncbi:D site-binding protein-like [Spodoptera litura]|uniref:D site-binding protein-like n=1 Tax=Spodoptera litura TaxID=69820 RepID=A0A9J7EFB7_SPOLT|nr:D site-binding protein-like [Spodoptera litura]
MSIWRPFSLEEVNTVEDDETTQTTEIVEPLSSDLSVLRVPQSVAVPVSAAQPTLSTYPVYPTEPGYLPLPLRYGDVQVSSGGSSGYHSLSTPSSSPPPGPPAAVSAPVLTAELDPDYQRYVEAAMAAIRAHQGGTLVGNNPNMRRAVRSQAHAGTAAEADAYRRTREKNNAAAKKSRDRRKLREVELSVELSYLKQQLAALKATLRSRACTRCRRSCLC